MRDPIHIIQIIVALGLLNVWLVRFRRKTPYRGGTASSMLEEFTVYGLPLWSAYVIGALKVGAALFLIAGLWVPVVVLPAASLIAILMMGALAMHWRVRDPMKKYLPAFIMLLLSFSICMGSIH